MSTKGRKRRRQPSPPATIPSPRQRGGSTTTERREHWTAVGAARAARAARIATSAHLRDAEIAHRWELSKVIGHLEMWRHYFYGSSRTGRLGFLLGRRQSARRTAAIEEATAEVFYGGAGLLKPYPSTIAEGAKSLLDLRAADLDAAVLYVLSPALCDVVVAAAQTLTVDDLALLKADDLPSPTGLIWLPHPVLVRAVNRELGDDRAFCWYSPATIVSTRRGRRVETPAFRATNYHDGYGPVRPDSFRDMAAQAGALGTPLPPLMPDGLRLFPFEPEVTEADRTGNKRLSESAIVTTKKYRDAQRALGENLDDGIEASFAYQPGDEVDDSDDLFTIRFLHAFWHLTRQGIAQTAELAANHSAQLDAARAGVDSEVRVVTLRPSSRRSGEESAARDWQHRWVVRMHKVRQWYPSEKRHKILYRGPYIKGPADKPLLAGDVVRAVTHKPHPA